MQKLKNKVKSKKLKDKIIILEIFDQIDFDKINNIPSDKIFDLYKISDCFIMPSKIESFGIVSVEAMSFGLPVIASKSPGNSDILKNGEYGIIFDGSKKALLEIIKRLANNKDLVIKYSKKSLKRSTKYDWSKIVESYISIYKKLIKNSFPVK